MSLAFIPHTHPHTWHSTADWLELRVHLIGVHGENPDDVDHLTLDAGGIARRRGDAEIRHQARHSEALPQAG